MFAPFAPSAKVIKDSISPTGKRLTTMEVTGHRFILAEFNTHRAFSRNSASSRAIPYAKMREKALSQTAYPVSWPGEQRGMQGGAEVSDRVRLSAEAVWENAVEAAVAYADQLHGIGVHKSVVNRLLEPFLPHTIIVTATEWDGFWAQRCHPDAQPEIRVLAEAMKEAYDASEPFPMVYGEWHLPYVTGEDVDLLIENAGEGYWDIVTLLLDSLKLSVARSARVSYLTHNGVRSVADDLTLYDRLYGHKPAHASPFEHQATPDNPRDERRTKGNFVGWHQLRHVLDLG